MASHPRLADVAARAGVSPATVSRVMNGKVGVAEATRRAVLEAAAALGYRHTTPRGDGLIGIIVPELDNPIFAAYGQQLTNLAGSKGYTPMVCTQTPTGILEDDWIEALLERNVAGIVVVSGMHADTHTSPARYQRLVSLGIPLALINGYMQGVEALFLSDDDRTAMQLAVNHLSSLGHTRVGLAVGQERYVPVIRKVEGFMEAAQRAGVEPIVEHSLFSIEGGHAASLRLLAKGVTAVICGSDLMALGVIWAARAQGLSVPDDLSVVGYDDTQLTAYTDPPLTTVRQSVAAICQAAVGMLVDQLDGNPPPRQEYLFRSQLVVRSSTGPAPAVQLLRRNIDPPESGAT